MFEPLDFSRYTSVAVFEPLYLSLCIWAAVFESLYLSRYIWAFVCEPLYLCLRMWAAVSEPLYLNRDRPLLPVPAQIDGAGTVSEPDVVVNRSITLACPASGIPLPAVTWYKEDTRITANGTRILILDAGWRLQLLNAEVNDAGRYYCQALNVAGKAEKYYDLHVLGESLAFLVKKKKNYFLFLPNYDLIRSAGV